MNGGNLEQITDEVRLYNRSDNLLLYREALYRFTVPRIRRTSYQDLASAEEEISAEIHAIDFHVCRTFGLLFWSSRRPIDNSLYNIFRSLSYLPSKCRPISR